MAKSSYRMFPSLSLEEAVGKLRQSYSNVGRGPSSKEAFITGLGYKSVSGASSRVFGALIHYGFFEKAGRDYKISQLGMHIILPDTDDESLLQGYLRQAAIHPTLFRDIYNKYEGEKLPTMLHNTLVHDFRVHDKSGKEAANNFRKTLEHAGLLENGIVGGAEKSNIPQENDDINPQGIIEGVPEGYGNLNSDNKNPIGSSAGLMNKIEIVLRAGEKAGIYAPYNLTEEEKNKLKNIIDLL
jgi:hypothetical protein